MSVNAGNTIPIPP